MGNTESSPLKYCSGNQGQLYTERHYGQKEQMMNMGPSRVNFTVPTIESKVEKFSKRYTPAPTQSRTQAPKRQVRQSRRQARPSQQLIQVNRQQLQDDIPQAVTSWFEATKCKIDQHGLCDCQREGFTETARELMLDLERKSECTNWAEATACKYDNTGLCDCQREEFKQTAKEIVEEEEKKILAASVKPRGVDVDTYLNRKEPKFNVYISCLDWDCDEVWDGVMKECEELPKLEPEVDLEDAAEIEQSIKDTMKVYEGLFGHVIVHVNGLVLYTDINGEKHCEDFDAEGLRKTFPMGISYGSLTKSIWFDDPVERDNCFDEMTKALEKEDIQNPPSYADVIANPDYYVPQPQRQQMQMPVEDCFTDSDDENIKVFEGINQRDVIVHADNLVLYTDINSVKHCVNYNPREIKKSFPNGISYGGLPKSIWFGDAQERDLCYALMQWNMDAPKKKVEKDEENIKVFEGINRRDVIVHADNLVLYTDINGAKHCVNYNPREIKKSFPNGISYGGLPKSIWFSDAQERDLCYALMQWNMDAYTEQEEEADVYEGLYGRVTVHKDGQVEFTSLTGDRVKCYYEPSEIAEVFPMGISYGRLPKTIWFNEPSEREACLEKMRNIDN